MLIFWYSYFKCVCLFHLYYYLDPFPQVFIVSTGEQHPGLPWGLHLTVALISFQCHIIFSFHARFFPLWDYAWPSGSLSVAIQGIRVQIHGSNSDPKSLFEVIVSYLFEWHLGSGGDRVMLVARLQIPEPRSSRHYSELLKTWSLERTLTLTKCSGWVESGGPSPGGDEGVLCVMALWVVHKYSSLLINIWFMCTPPSH